MFEFQASVGLIVGWAILIVALIAFLDAVSRPAQAYLAADKMTKQGWTLILGLAVLVQFLLGGGILGLVALVASIVYLVDARPALQAVRRRR